MLRASSIVAVSALLVACGTPTETKKKNNNNNNNNNGGLTAAATCEALCDLIDECDAEGADPACADDCEDEDAQLGELFGTACTTASRTKNDCVGDLSCSEAEDPENDSCTADYDDYLYECATDECQSLGEKFADCGIWADYGYSSPLDYMYDVVDANENGQYEDDEYGPTYCGLTSDEGACAGAWHAFFGCLGASGCSDIEDITTNDASTVCAAESADIDASCGA